MSTNVTLNGSTYAIPAEGDTSWGTALSNYFIAIASATLQKSGGTFTLTAEANFGATYGLKSAYLKSQATNPASAGQVRLGNAETIKWRNAANGGDLALTVNASDVLQFNGANLLYSGAASIVNADVNASAAIAYSKLNLSSSIVNADISNSAAIAYSKLALTGAILDADLAGSIAYSKLSLTGAILNADLAGSIAASKLVGSDIATVGTITSGTWSGTTIALNKGGTGQTTKAAAFDALSPLTTSGDILYGGASGTGTRLAKGSDGQYLTLSSGIPAWTSSTTANLSVSSVKTSTYAIQGTDEVILVDGTSAFTTTLPTAAGVTGKVYKIKRVDQTLANAVTIATTSSQTIDGVTTRKLCTQYEEYTVVSDGSNWQVVSHTYPSGWTSYTPTLTNFGTVTLRYGKWRRIGDSIQVEVKFNTGTVASSTADSTVPSGLTIDPFYGSIRTAFGSWVRDTTNEFTVGPMLINTDNGNRLYFGPAQSISSGGASPHSLAAANTFVGNNQELFFYATAKVTGWEP